MRIVHSITSIGRGAFGVGSVAGNLVSNQRILGLDARVWSVDAEADVRQANEDYGFDSNVVQAFAPFGPRSWGFSRTMAHAAACSEDIDIVHQHGIWTGISANMAAWRRINRGRLVIAPHGSMAAWAMRRSVWKKRIALAAYEKSNLVEAGCIHALSTLEVQQAREFGVSGPIACIPSGVTTDWIESTGDASRFRKQFKLPDGQRLLLFVGRISPVKNLPSLIRAWNLTGACGREWGLVLLGSPEFGHDAELRRVIAEYKMNDRVHWVGSLYGRSKRDAFAAAECLVLPSYTENFGVVVLEAMAVGRPSLTSTGGPWAILPIAKAGWRLSPDVDSLAAGLLEVFGSTVEKLQSMGRSAQELARRDYAWPSICARTQELYKWLRFGGSVPEFVSVD